MRPPGTANCRRFCSACSETIRGRKGRQLKLPLASLGDDSRSELNLLANLEHTLQNTATSDTALELVDT